MCQASRPLLVALIGAATLLAFRLPLGLDLRVETSSGSQNLVGALPFRVIPG